MLFVAISKLAWTRARVTQTIRLDMPGRLTMGGTAFVYGTLMAPEVLNLLIKRVPPHKPAKLSGFSRYRVKGQVFPAIVPAAPSSQVSGLVMDILASA